MWWYSPFCLGCSRETLKLGDFFHACPPQSKLSFLETHPKATWPRTPEHVSLLKRPMGKQFLFGFLRFALASYGRWFASCHNGPGAGTTITSLWFRGQSAFCLPSSPPPRIPAGGALWPWCGEDVLWILVLEAQPPECLPMC